MDKAMKILVVDNDATECERIRGILSESEGDYELAGAFADAGQAIAFCRSARIDLVLLDARTSADPVVTEVAQGLAELDPSPRVVLMTPDRADPPAPPVDVPTGEAVAKPIERGALLQALARARRAMGRSRRSAERREEGPEPTPPRRLYISAHYRGGIRSVKVEDVFYLLAEHKYVTVRHLGGEMLVDESLKAFETEFPDLFRRIHRNALVARARVVDLQKVEGGTWVVRLSGCPEALQVSRRHVSEVRRWLRESD